MKKVLLFLAHGVEPFEAAAFTDVLGWASEHGNEKIKVITAGIRRKIVSTFGININPDKLLKEVKLSDFDALAIPGGFEKFGYYEDAFSEEFLEVIRLFNQKKKIIATICTGALPVGKSGVLAGRKATTYHLSGGKRRRQLKKMGANVQNKRLVIDKNIITSTSPETAVDVAFTLLAQLTNSKNVAKIRKLMGYEKSR